MPELPDVEGFRRLARRHGTGKVLRSVHGRVEGLAGTGPQGLARSLSGSRFANPRRHGKWMIWPTDHRLVVFHFGMDGGLAWSRDGEHGRYERLAFRFDNGELRYHSRRKLGGVWLAADDDELHEITGPLSQDALRVSPSRFLDALAHTRGRVKPRLMDQEVLAGLGNLTVDETLWRARIDPRRELRSLSESDRSSIERAAKAVLRKGAAAGRVPDDDSSLTGQRAAESPRCPRCRTPLETFKVDGRTTYACPQCQS